MINTLIIIKEMAYAIVLKTKDECNQWYACLLTPNRSLCTAVCLSVVLLLLNGWTENNFLQVTIYRLVYLVIFKYK